MDWPPLAPRFDSKVLSYVPRPGPVILAANPKTSVLYLGWVARFSVKMSVP